MKHVVPLASIALAIATFGLTAGYLVGSSPVAAARETATQQACPNSASCRGNNCTTKEACRKTNCGCGCAGANANEPKN